MPSVASGYLFPNRYCGLDFFAAPTVTAARAATVGSGAVYGDDVSMLPELPKVPPLLAVLMVPLKVPRVLAQAAVPAVLVPPAA